MTLNKALFSSETDLWSTPKDLFDRLNDEFHFETDVCALSENTKCGNYFTPEMNGLKQVWTGVCWMNPPYSRQIIKWMKKAHEETFLYSADTVACLVPNRSDTKWYGYAMMSDEIRLVEGRIKFGNAKSGAPFPSAIVIFRHEPIYNYTYDRPYLTRFKLK